MVWGIKWLGTRVGSSAPTQQRKSLALCDAQALGEETCSPKRPVALCRKAPPGSRLYGKVRPAFLGCFRAPPEAFLAADPWFWIPDLGIESWCVHAGNVAGGGREARREALPAPALLSSHGWAAAGAVSPLTTSGQHPASPTVAAQLTQSDCERPTVCGDRANPSRRSAAFMHTACGPTWTSAGLRNRSASVDFSLLFLHYLMGDLTEGGRETKNAH